MRIAIHQPEFMPWLGYFDKMARVDTYVIFDHVQFKKRYFENRNKIKQDGETIWLNVPVLSKGKYAQPINEVLIDNSTPWQKKGWEKIRHCYGKSSCFQEYAEELKNVFISRDYSRLMDFNLACIIWFRQILRINTPLVYSSALDVRDYKASDLILRICLRLGATEYLCGPSGKDYLQLDDFEKNNITVIWQDFKHPEYPQFGDGFVPYLSTLDLVMNCGKESRNILLPDIGD